MATEFPTVVLHTLKAGPVQVRRMCLRRRFFAPSLGSPASCARGGGETEDTLEAVAQLLNFGKGLPLQCFAGVTGQKRGRDPEVGGLRGSGLAASGDDGPKNKAIIGSFSLCSPACS